jgi:hypothetical protein
VTELPHFSVPFRFTPAAAVTDQGSIDEIVDCIVAILVCRRGFRVELPAFGLPDPTFTSPGPDLDEIRRAVETWEPRAAVTLTEYPDLLDELVARVELGVQLRTED